MKKIGILGSTGSIGRNTLDVIAAKPERFKPVFLSANTQVDRLIQQAKTYRPEAVCIADESNYAALRRGLSGTSVTCLAGEKGILELIAEGGADLIVNAIVGAAGMAGTIEAVKRGTHVALSNKESLVMAGELINALCEKSGARLYPVDSEHSAIWQCLSGETIEDVEKLILTGSGGPFLRRPLSSFDSITPEEALRHPNWSMGKKITIDSATMFNKGLELIEAYHLFHLKESQIEILIHPESIVHSLVGFHDGSVKAQLGMPDMKVPIQYALSYPRHLQTRWPRLDLAEIAELHFERPDTLRFPSLRIAREALKKGGTYPAVLNMANERAVSRFLEGKISFTDIFNEVENALEHHQSLNPLSQEDLNALF